MIDNYQKNIILEKYLREATRNYSRVANYVHKINFPCNICGNGITDSSHSKYSRRGWLVFKHDNWWFNCFNCGYKTNAERWLKQYHSESYRSYFKEILSVEFHDKKVEFKKFESVKEQKVDDKKEAKTFKSILSKDNKLFTDAINNCIERKIPETIYKKWFVSDSGFYKNRIIIPFYNKNNKIIYWQARSIYNREPKYLNCSFDKNKLITNQLDFIDENKEVILVEGYIDSLFIDNCIFSLSTNWSNENQEHFDSLNIHYMLDYDVTKETNKKIQQLLKAGKMVFNWKKFLKDNGYLTNIKWDINSLYLHEKRETKYLFSDFSQYFTNSWMDKFWFV
jgi:hypothetical protein